MAHDHQQLHKAGIFFTVVANCELFSSLSNLHHTAILLFCPHHSFLLRFPLGTGFGVQTPDKCLEFAVGNILASSMSRQGRSAPVVCTQCPVAAIVTTMVMKWWIARRFKAAKKQPGGALQSTSSCRFPRHQICSDVGGSDLDMKISFQGLPCGRPSKQRRTSPWLQRVGCWKINLQTTREVACCFLRKKRGTPVVLYIRLSVHEISSDYCRKMKFFCK